uniref:Uncharacterized protein n=1 Tax=Schistocephalus solidus TaxID=70667 RepID=A0A0X3NMY3_SCHSO
MRAYPSSSRYGAINPRGPESKVATPAHLRLPLRIPGTPLIFISPSQTLPSDFLILLGVCVYLENIKPSTLAWLRLLSCCVESLFHPKFNVCIRKISRRHAGFRAVALEGFHRPRIRKIVHREPSLLKHRYFG